MGMKRATPLCDRLRALRVGAVAAILVLGAACDEDDPSGPEGVPVLGGRWSYEASFAGTGVVCTLPRADILIDPVVGDTRFDARFEGTISSFDIACEREGRRATLRFGATGIVNGLLRGDQIAFDIETPDLLHTGTVVGDRMEGTVAVRLDLTQTPLDVTDTLNLTGDWEAQRR